MVYINKIGEMAVLIKPNLSGICEIRWPYDCSAINSGRDRASWHSERLSGDKAEVRFRGGDLLDSIGFDESGLIEEVQIQTRRAGQQGLRRGPDHRQRGRSWDRAGGRGGLNQWGSYKRRFGWRLAGRKETVGWGAHGAEICRWWKRMV